MRSLGRYIRKKQQTFLDSLINPQIVYSRLAAAFILLPYVVSSITLVLIEMLRLSQLVVRKAFHLSVLKFTRTNLSLKQDVQLVE